jgi:hypothetical protein
VLYFYGGRRADEMFGAIIRNGREFRDGSVILLK